MDIEFVKWLATGGLGGAIISFLLKSWFETRLKNSIKHEYDSKLLELKSALEKDSAALASIQNHYKTVNVVGHEKVIAAVHSLWSGMVELRRIKPSILTFCDVLTEDEFGDVLGNHKSQAFAEIKNEDINKLFEGKLEAASEHRVFSGELLFSYLSSYQRLIARISFLIKEGRLNGNVPLWWEDSICKDVIFSVCSDEDIEEFKKLKSNKINWMLNHIEQRFLREATKVISGDNSIDKAYEQSARILKKYSSEKLFEK